MKNELAVKLAAVLNDYFVYDMPDIDDMVQANADQLSSIDGCHDIINQLLDIIREAE